MRRITSRSALTLVAALSVWPGMSASAASLCGASVAGEMPHVVELYTSEACSTCPPVDRWLSQLKGHRSVVPLSFHVDYFDHLGWKDRFASAAYTRRQKEILDSSGARFAYTPQLVIDGKDRKQGVNGTALQRPAPASLAVGIERDGEGYVATLQSSARETLHVAGYWAISEDDLASDVSAGENAGRTLHHDFVVRDYRQLQRFEVAPGATIRLDFMPKLAGLPNRPRAVALVLNDAATGAPLQAVRVPAC